MYKKKYLKYKKKYIDFKLQIGGNPNYFWYNDEQEKKHTFFPDGKFSFLPKEIPNEKFTPLVCNENQKIFENLAVNPINRYYLTKNHISHSDVRRFKYDNKVWHKKITFDDKYLNPGLIAFTLLKVMCLLEKNFFNFFNFDNIDLLSIGSGNGLFESLCQQIFGIPILCVDPNPLGFMSFDLKKPFIEPRFKNTLEYFTYDKKKDETVLFLIWPETPNKGVLPYDLDAILLLKPLAFFIIYSDNNLSAGSSELWKLIENDSFDVGFQTYKKKFKRNGTINIVKSLIFNGSAVVKLALFVNDSKYQLFEDNRLKFYKTPFIQNYTTVDEEMIELGDFDPHKD